MEWQIGCSQNEKDQKSKEFQVFIQVLIIQIVRLKFRVGNSKLVWVKIITLSEVVLYHFVVRIKLVRVRHEITTFIIFCYQ